MDDDGAVSALPGRYAGVTRDLPCRSTTDPDVAAVLAWWDGHGRDLPWRATRDVYGIWVAEVMSAQTSVLRAAEFWERWMAAWPTVDALAAAPLADVLAAWQGLGYPRRARYLHLAARQVVEGGWPDDLTELPGVGPYVAAAISCFAREEPVLPRDVNVVRVLARRFPEGVDTAGDPWRAGQALMEFGQRICTARPRCGDCVVSSGCDVRGAPAAAAPVAARRQPRFEGSVRQRRGELLRRVLAEGSVERRSADAAAAAGLLADGLIAEDGEVLVPPR
jgi:A/G-specific adenine glycosylase